MEQDHLEEFKEFLEKTKGLSNKTIKDYVYWIKGFEIEKISQSYINKYSQKRGNNSGIRGVLLNLLEYTGLKKTYDLPPKATGRTRKRVVRDISKNEINIVREHIYSESFKKGLIFDLLYQGALRRGEIPSITLSSFKWLEWIDNPDQQGKLIVKGKGDKERIVLINSQTMEMIFNHYNKLYMFENIEQITAFANSNSLLFTNDGRKISEWYVWNVIHIGSKKILNRNIRTHELRHCRATELERLNVPIRDIKNYLGHSTLATTEIYLHKSEKESIQNIQNILNKG